MTKILVIEDEEILREEVALWLMQEGYDVTDVGDGVEGIEAALKEPPDLIVCDIMMPRLDGYGVLLELRSYPEMAKVPFIFLTAKATHIDMRRGMALGADDYMTKPFTRMELLQAIRARLDVIARQAQKHDSEVLELQSALQTEREQRMVNAKMVAMFSHDFRNPLAAILSANDLLRHFWDRIDDQRRQTYMSRIEMAGHQLLQMLDEMLVIAQMESGRFEVELEPMLITSFLSKIVEEFQATNGERYQIDFASQLPNEVMADRRLMRQICANLISNAVKYSPGGGKVHVRLDRVSDDKYLISVQDFGLGISKSDQPKLFTAFQRGSNTKNLPGTGLGLSIVKQAVEMQEGQVEIESDSGVGTTIRVLMPM